MLTGLDWYFRICGGHRRSFETDVVAAKLPFGPYLWRGRKRVRVQSPFYPFASPYIDRTCPPSPVRSRRVTKEGEEFKRTGNKSCAPAQKSTVSVGKLRFWEGEDIGWLPLWRSLALHCSQGAVSFLLPARRCLEEASRGSFSSLASRGGAARQGERCGLRWPPWC